MRVSLIRGAPREFLASLEIDGRWFDWKRRAPTSERIVLAAYVPQPFVWEPRATEESQDVGRVTLVWRKFGIGQTDTDRLWALEIVEEPVEWGVLLNVAYTCRTHVNMGLAMRVREQLEGVLCPVESRAGVSRMTRQGNLPPDEPLISPEHSAKPREDIDNPPVKYRVADNDPTLG